MATWFSKLFGFALRSSCFAVYSEMQCNVSVAQALPFIFHWRMRDKEWSCIIILHEEQRSIYYAARLKERKVLPILNSFLYWRYRNLP